METIKIVNGRRGYHLKVNGMFISHGFANSNQPNPIRAILPDHGVPYGATEWVSVEAIRRFWHKYMALSIAATLSPCRSVCGQLEFINTYKIDN